MAIFQTFLTNVGQRVLPPLVAPRPPGILTPEGLSTHFLDFCQANGFGKEVWANKKVPGYGGKQGESSGDVARDPVLFIHGTGGDAQDCEEQLRYFLDRGYQPHELYAISLHRHRAFNLNGLNQNVSPRTIKATQRAIEAVTAYTGRKPVVISHSQGGLWSWAASAGGAYTDSFGELHEFPGVPVKRWMGLAVPFWGVPKVNTLRRALPFLGMSNSLIGLPQDSEQLRRVRSAHPDAEDGVYSLASNGDGLIGDGEGSVQNGSASFGYNIRMEGLSHGECRMGEPSLEAQYQVAMGEFNPREHEAQLAQQRADGAAPAPVQREERLRDLDSLATILTELGTELAAVPFTYGRLRSTSATLQQLANALTRPIAVARRLAIPELEKQELVTSLVTAQLTVEELEKNLAQARPYAFAHAAWTLREAEKACQQAVPEGRFDFDFDAAPTAAISGDWLDSALEDPRHAEALEKSHFFAQNRLLQLSALVTRAVTRGQGVRIIGAENLPAEGPFILATVGTNPKNEVPIYLSNLMRGRDVTMRQLVREGGRAMNRMGTMVGSVLLPRGEKANEGYAVGKELAEKGQTLVMRLEHSRPSHDVVGVASEATARMALETGLPVVPVALEGGKNVAVRRRGGRRDLVLQVGTPVSGEGAPTSPENIGVMRDRLQRAGQRTLQAAKEAADEPLKKTAHG